MLHNIHAQHIISRIFDINCDSLDQCARVNGSGDVLILSELLCQLPEDHWRYWKYWNHPVTYLQLFPPVLLFNIPKKRIKCVIFAGVRYFKTHETTVCPGVKKVLAPGKMFHRGSFSLFFFIATD